MPSTREVQAAHDNRMRRKAAGPPVMRTYFTPERTGPPCPVCGEATSLKVAHAGQWAHPCCQGL